MFDHTHKHYSFSLSLSIYIYIYIYISGLYIFSFWSDLLGARKSAVIFSESKETHS